ncbi:MAG: flavodoxin family protein [Dissulfuribacterales bacterium]
MQVLILYYSKGGNTRRLAEAIADGVRSVHGVRSLLKKTEDVTKDDFLESEGIIAGSPVYFGLMAAQLKKVFYHFPHQPLMMIDPA